MVKGMKHRIGTFGREAGTRKYLLPGEEVSSGRSSLGTWHLGKLL